MRTPVPLKLYPKNDQTITLRGLKDNTGALVTGATVTATLVDGDSVPQSGINNLAMADVIDYPGSYAGSVDEDFNAAPGTYTLQIAATASGLNYYAEKPVTVQVRAIC